MGVIAKDHKKINLYYNSNTNLGKQTYVYILAAKEKVLAIDVSKTKVTATQWSELADYLNINVSELVNTNHPDFIRKYGVAYLNMEEYDWLKILEKRADVITYPIIMNGNRCTQIKKLSDALSFL